MPAELVDDESLAEIGAAMVENFAVIVANLGDGEILYASQKAEELFGYFVRGELSCTPVDDLVPVDLRSAHILHRANYQKEPRARLMGRGNQSLKGVKRDGTEFDVLVSLCPRVWRGERCVIVVVIDLTGRTAESSDI